MPPLYLEVKETKEKGRGVFALKNFRKGSVIEVCPIIAIIKDDQCPRSLEKYPYQWTKKKCAIAGGYGSFYNHSYSPNADVDYDRKNKLIMLIAKERIIKNDEITFCYYEDEDVGWPLGFRNKE